MGQLPLVHLAKRFFGSLSPVRPAPEDQRWVESHLVAPEVVLWRRMSAADQRHAVGVARRVATTNTDRPVLAAALLHDIGKIDAGLGTFGRVAATLIGRQRARGRFAIYLRHDAIGASLLSDVGSDPLTIAWAREHHRAPERWTVPREIGEVLKAADDD